MGRTGPRSAADVTSRPRPHEDVTNHALKYATNTSGAWQTYVIDSSTTVSGMLGLPAGYTAIAVDSGGNVHISYRGDSRLRVASNP